MRLHLHQNINRLFHKSILVRVRISKQPICLNTLDHRRIVTVSRQYASGTALVGIANHRKEGFFLRLAINNPVRIKYLVPTML